MPSVRSAWILLVAVAGLLFGSPSLLQPSPWAESAPESAGAPQAGAAQRCGSPENPGPCFVYLPIISRPSYPQSALPIGFNSGGWDYPLPDGRLLRQDQEYTITNGAGYVDGSPATNDFEFEPIEATDYPIVYRTARTGLSGYRFNVPNGSYLIELHMAEVRRHGPEFRVFDVTIEGQRVLEALDLYALAQHDYAVRWRFAAEVRDKQLDVNFAASTGEPLLSAIWVSPRAADNQPPAAPAATHAVGGYRRAIVRWPHAAADDVAGYRVYRSAAPGGPFQLVTARPTPLARFFDDAVTPGQTYCYAVAAVDVFGNEGLHGPTACAAVVDASASSLPVLNLTISAQNLHLLAANPALEVEVPAILTVGGQPYSVMAEYRGQSTQYSNKKSWKLVADRPIPDLQTDTLLLNGEGYDPAVLREKVAYDLYEASGIRPQQASFVHLTLNGEFIGVFTRIENPDRDFLQRSGRNRDDDLFKCQDGLDTQPNCDNQIVAGRSTDELYAFAALINNTPDADFAAAIADVLDVRGFLDYQAILAVTADADSTHQFLLHRERAAGRWHVLPWDNNVTFFDPQQPLDYGASSNPGWGYQTNALLTRVLAVPQYRRYYSEKVLELLDSLFSLPAMTARLAAARQAIWFDAERDVWKVHREDNDAFAVSQTHLPYFAAWRVSYLSSAAPAFMPQQSRFIGINEVMARNAGSVIDPADGRADPWFELFNAGLRPVDIGGMFLSDSLATPARFRIPAGTVLPPLSAALFWADSQPEQGPNHVNFTLPSAGGQIYLVERDRATTVDAVSFPALAADTSWGRFPDFDGSWMAQRHPSAGQPNRLPPPVITDVEFTPRFPQASNAVTVTATIGDDGSVSAASLLYTDGGATIALTLFDDGFHGDGAANDGRYGAVIPALPNGRVVSFYISATDDYGRTALHPAAAPALTHRYRVGLAPAFIAISEFMAENAATIADPEQPGQYPDWIELTNLGAAPVNLNGFYLTDNLLRPTKFRISGDVIVAPGEAILFWADDDPQQGPRHTTFKLNKEGEAIGLFHRDGATAVDTVEFGVQFEDISYGRCGVQGAAWGFHYLPTPGQPNACGRQYLPLAIRQ